MSMFKAHCLQEKNSSVRKKNTYNPSPVLLLQIKRPPEIIHPTLENAVSLTPGFSWMHF